MFKFKMTHVTQHDIAAVSPAAVPPAAVYDLLAVGKYMVGSPPPLAGVLGHLLLVIILSVTNNNTFFHQEQEPQCCCFAPT